MEIFYHLEILLAYEANKTRQNESFYAKHNIVKTIGTNLMHGAFKKYRNVTFIHPYFPHTVYSRV